MVIIHMYPFSLRKDGSNITQPLELLWWFSDKESTCQCRRCSFDPWVGKIRWKKKCQPTPVFLPGKSHGQKSWVGYIVHGGSQRVRHDFVIKQLQTSQPPRMRLFILHPWLGTASAARAQLILVTTAPGQGSLPRKKSLTPFVYKWGIYSCIL